MKIFINILFIMFFTISINATDRKVLVEIFTNSHCVLCPGAHATLDNYLSTNPNGANTNYIYYHMPFPYSDDLLSQANTTDPAIRNNFYGPFGSTPRGIFNGALQNISYSSWGGVLDGMAAEESPFEILLSGIQSGNETTLIADVTQTIGGSFNSLRLYIAAVENVSYQGRNGINQHKNVMREMYPDAEGKGFSIQEGQQVQLEEAFIPSANWAAEQLGFVVFIQDVNSKIIYQSEYISYQELLLTDVEDEFETIPSKYYLGQNYPNPFNPSTTITYHIPEITHVNISVYDLLGNKTVELVDGEESAGSKSINWNIRDYGISSGMYFYVISTPKFKETKKMILLK